MLSFLKKLFGGGGSAVSQSAQETVQPARVPPPPPAPSKPREEAGRATPPQSQSQSQGGDGKGTLSLPLEVLLPAMPAALRAQLNPGKARAATLQIPISAIVPQLKTGGVKFTVKELRDFAPNGAIPASAETDSTSVALPLEAILSRIKPDQLQKRSGQTATKLPEDVPMVFGRSGLVARDAKAAPPSPAPPPAAAEPVKHAPVETAPATPTVGASLESLPPLEAEDALPQALSAAGVEVEPPAVSVQDGFLILPLSAVTMGLPPSAQAALAKPGGRGLFLRVPTSELEAGLKRGKLVFPWSALRTWLSGQTQGGSAQEDTADCELPLKQVAPAVMASRTSIRMTRKLVVPENIPDLFAKSVEGTSPAPVPPASAKPEPASPPPATKASELSELFGQPGKAQWSPAELVASAAGLKGCIGAVMASKDGLRIAAELPAKVSGDGVSAFLPAIFTRMSNLAKELGQAEPSRLGIVIDSTPCRLWRAGDSYFAVFGKDEKAFDPAQLGVLDRHFSGFKKSK